MVEYTKPEEVVMLREIAISKTALGIANQCLEWTRQLQLETIGAIVTRGIYAGVEL